MSGRFLALLLVATIFAGCGNLSEIGDRYRAERDLWNANREISRLRIRPDLITDEERKTALNRYESIVDNYAAIPARADSSEGAQASREVRAIVARALLSAASLQAEMGDSTGMLQKYDRIEQEYSDLPIVAGEVAFARGQLAEAKGDWGTAASAYQEIVNRVEPDPSVAGLPGMVLNLPMRIVQLRMTAAGEGAQPGPFLQEADQYYQGVIASRPGTLAEADARWFRASLARESGDPGTALRELRTMEALVRDMKPLVRDPSRVRLAMIEIQNERGGSPDSIVAMSRGLINDYPESRLAPQTLLTAASSLLKAKRTDEALGLLDEIEEKYSNYVDVAATAMQIRGQALEGEGRWPEALSAFNTLQKSYPLTTPAIAAPLQIAAHYEKVGDTASRDRALEDAEKSYQSFLERYPNNERTLEARGRLIQTLAARKKFDEMVNEMTGLGESIIRSPQGLRYLIQAAQVAVAELGDSARAATILDRLAKEFPGKEVGDWAEEEAGKLRGNNPK